jgi:hypothetical protein
MLSFYMEAKMKKRLVKSRLLEFSVKEKLTELHQRHLPKE